MWIHGFSESDPTQTVRWSLRSSWKPSLPLSTPSSFRITTTNSSFPVMEMEGRITSIQSVIPREVLFPRIQDDILDNLKTHSQQLPAVRKFLLSRIKKLMSSVNPNPPSTLDACLSRTMCYILISPFFHFLYNTPQSLWRRQNAETHSHFQCDGEPDS